MRQLVRLLALIVVALALPSQGWAAERLALVIGNNAYDRAPLVNPVNDARVLGAMLHDLGWEVHAVEDAGRDAMITEVSAFAQKLGPDDTALFFYAGHAVQYEGVNYLLPTDIDIDAPDDLPEQGVAVNEVMERLNEAGVGISLIILDSCRDNPFLDEEYPKGMAEFGFAPGETLIVTATRAGDVAQDGSGVNSPFTSALVSMLELPKLDVFEVFRGVRSRVRQATNGLQLPWVSGSLEREFVFNNEEEAAPVATSGETVVEAAEAVLRALELETTNVALKPPTLPDQVNSLGVTDCDLLTADRNDPLTVALGVPDGLVNTRLAIPACAAALAEDPENPRLMFQLGRALDIARRYEDAVYFYRQAIDRGYSAAMVNLGVMYTDRVPHRFFERNDSEAFGLYQTAAQLGNVRAITNIGEMYLKGWGVEPNEQEALHWYQLAAQKGRYEAINGLANLYRDGNGMAEPDLAEAMRLYQLAAGLGSANAMSNIGALYRDGKGVEQNYEEAIRWFTQAMDLGNTFAPFNLARLYRDGQGVEANGARAVELFELAAARNHPDAHRAIGDMYAQGKGVPEQPVEAFFHYTIAVATGDDDAEAKLQEVAPRLSQAEREEATRRAEQWVRQNGR